MATLRVHGLQEQVVERLRRRAAANGRSLEEEARRILEQAVEYDFEAKRRAFRDLSARLRAATGGVPQTPSHVLIREDRESGHRDG